MNRNLSVLILVFINILWGSTYAVTKVALLEIPPPLLGALRWISATALLWLGAYVQITSADGAADADVARNAVIRNDELRI